MNRFSFVSIVTAACFFSLLSGCSSEVSTGAHLEGAASIGAADSSGVSANLDSLVQAYINEMWPDANIAIVVDADGRVTLDGTVASQEDEQSIEQEVSSLSGVTRVRNRLKVAE